MVTSSIGEAPEVSCSSNEQVEFNTSYIIDKDGEG